MRELSVVIIGVLVTLLITNILSDRARQAEVERALTLSFIDEWYFFVFSGYSLLRRKGDALPVCVPSVREVYRLFYFGEVTVWGGVTLNRERNREIYEAF